MAPCGKGARLLLSPNFAIDGMAGKTRIKFSACARYKKLLDCFRIVNEATALKTCNE